RPRPALLLEADLQDRDRGGLESLFPHGTGGWAPPDYEAQRRRRDEWECLGFVTEPLLMALFRPGLPGGLLTSRDLAGQVGRRVRVAGVTATARQALTEQGRVMQFVTLQDEWGLMEVTLFPDTCPLPAQLLLGPYLVEGMVEEQY